MNKRTNPTLQADAAGAWRRSRCAGLPERRRGRAGSAGGSPADAPVVIASGERALIPTGFAIAVPQGFEAQVRPRSGLALRHGVTVLNTPGTIDSDYRGELKVILINHGADSFSVERGLRIAQLVLAPVAQVEVVVAESLDDTARGEGGFGSTGTAVTDRDEH